MKRVEYKVWVYVANDDETLQQFLQTKLGDHDWKVCGMLGETTKDILGRVKHSILITAYR